MKSLLHSALVILSAIGFAYTQKTDSSAVSATPDSLRAEKEIVPPKAVPEENKREAEPGENADVVAKDKAPVKPDSSSVSAVLKKETAPETRADTGMQKADSAAVPSAAESTRNAVPTNVSAGEKKEAAQKVKADTVSIAARGNIKTPSVDLSNAVEIPSGVLFGEFNREDGPFLIKGNVIVPSGQILKFGPGCQIFVEGYRTITVFGQILAKGTSADPVVFQSASKTPHPWDWDRIYCRSRNRSVFENCIVRHSNYGIYVENGSISIDHCTFEHNSLHGVVVKNSDATITASTLRNGHVLALLCQEGAVVRCDSLIVHDNITGIACNDKSSLTVTGGKVNSNRNGIAVRKGAYVSIVAADVIRNKIGLVSEEVPQKKMLEMVYGNVVDSKTVDSKGMEELLKPPEEVKSIVLPKTHTEVKLNEDFKAGFSALQAPREPAASIIGNVEIGASYFMPKSKKHPVYDTTILQSRYPDGIQPELNVFMQGKRGDADVNLNADLYGNEWIQNNPAHLRKNMFALSMNYAAQSLLIGDFFENISETSISGRKMSGIKYNGGFWEMGRGNKRMEFKLAAGETEIAKDSGDNEIETYNDTVEAGLSIRQQLTYLASLSFKPTFNSTISARGIIAHDQTENPLFRKSIEDPMAPNPILAQTGCIDAVVELLDGNMEISAEVDMGGHDTVKQYMDVESTQVNPDYEDIAWYLPNVTGAVPKVFGYINPNKDNYAANIAVSGKLKGFNLMSSFTEIARDYFSAGNPYLESDRRYLTVSGDRQFNEKFGASAFYIYERRSASEEFDITLGTSSPEDKNTFKLGASYAMGGSLPTFSADWDLLLESSKDYTSYSEVIEYVVSTDSSYFDTVEYNVDTAFEVTNNLILQVKQRFDNGIDYTFKYRLRRENDMAGYADPGEKDKDDSWMHEFNARFGFNIKRILTNKTNVRVKFKDEVRDSLDGVYYKVSNNLRVNIIPRKLSVTLKGEYRRENEDEYDSDNFVYRNIILDSKQIEGVVKYSITSKLSVTLNAGYEKIEDDNEGGENYTVKIGGLHLTYLF